MESSAAAGPRKWIILLVWIVGLVFVGIGVAWQLYRILPGWIEDTAGEVLLENGIVLTDLPVEGIGWSQSRIGPGGMVYESHSITWDEIWVDYRLADLIEGQLGTVQVESPSIKLQLPDLEGALEEPDSNTDYLVPELVELEPDLPESSLLQEIAGTGKAETDIAQPVRQEANAASVELPGGDSLWSVLQDLRFERFRIHDGVVNISLLDENLTAFSLESEIVKEPFGVSGEFAIGNSDISSKLSLRAPAVVQIVTLQGQLTMPSGSLKNTFDLARQFMPALSDAPELVSSGNLTMDLLLELDEMDQPLGSGEIEVDGMVVADKTSGLEVGIDNLLAAGYFRDGVLKVESGAEIQLSPGEDYRTDAFGLHMSVDSVEGLEFETETFGWNYSGWEGKAAVRGSASLFADQGRVEVALSEIASEWMVTEPFSLLLEKRQGDLVARTSEIGIRKTDTLWIEDLAIEMNRAMDSASIGLTWYDAIGLHMGDFKSVVKIDEDDYQASYSVNEPGKPSFLTGEFSHDGESTSLNAKGRLLLPWVNSISAWWGGFPAKFSGNDPQIEVELSGKSPFFSGKARVELNDTSVELDGDTRLDGITGSSEFDIVGVPLIPDAQSLTIESISSGQFELQDVKLDWAMPWIGRLEIKRFEGSIGGGTISVDPFSFDPFKPVLQSQIHIDRLDGNQLLKWLGEERFSVEGSVSGRLVIGWRDGDIILGDGILELDSNEHDGRFVFEDPSFLKEQFDSFGGIQDDLKNRFLSALLEEGIDIHSLEISLGAAPEAGKILLRMAVSGETKNELLEVPIEGFIINNVISGEDLGRLMGLLGPVRILTDASGRN